LKNNTQDPFSLKLPADDPVAEDSLVGVARKQTNPKRWDGDSWGEFRDELQSAGITLRESRAAGALYVSDAGGLSFGQPSGVLLATTAEQVAQVMRAAQKHHVPVTTRGGGLTTEGESVAFGGLLLDMTGMSRVQEVDVEGLTVRTEAGIFWHHLAEHLRRQDMDYLSAPLNLTASVGGTIGVGGIDINSPRLGCSADQVISMQVVTPTGEICECNENENAELFERVILGYGQFGIITAATLKIRPFTPVRMYYYYYPHLRSAIEDMQRLVKEDAADYCGILTIMDSAINLLVAFDSDEREAEFMAKHRPQLRGHGEFIFGLKLAAHYIPRPWKWKEAFYLLDRRSKLFPEFNRPEYMREGRIHDRSVMFSRAVWKFWGGQQMVIPDLATNEAKFVEAVERGNAVCRRYFPHYTLYCVGIKLFDRRERYELSSIPLDAEDFAYGCEFEPMIENKAYSRDYLQSFKNEIYDIGVDMQTSYYRFGGTMKGYIRPALGDEVVDRHLALKGAADPAMILNSDVIF